MTRWRPQPFRAAAAAAGIDSTIVENAVQTATRMTSIHPDLPPVFTLRHLAHLSDVPYALLRKYAARDATDPYTTFKIHKRPLRGRVRFRRIAVPEPALLKVQSWITQCILAKVNVHSASRAFSKNDTLVRAVEDHCGCRWLIKIDIRNFFESINEVAVFRVFRSLGYQPLVAFELARMCTRMGGKSYIRERPRWQVWSRWKTITHYKSWNPTEGPRMGHLPQGAPTSPMLANLAVAQFDEEATTIAKTFGLTYTRYADDLILSTAAKEFSRDQARAVIGQITAALGKRGLGANSAKTSVSPPGSRKIALGLSLDGPSPRLPRHFKAKLREHLYYLENTTIGPVGHARARGFASVIGLRHHLLGLAAFASQIESPYGKLIQQRLDAIDWPL
ncbi:reverse transcriptase family protein [Metallibacterium scheffleri]